MWKMMAFDATECLTEPVLGIQNVIEVLVFDDEAHTHLCSMAPSYETFPVAVCVRLDRPVSDLPEEEEEQLDDFGAEWLNDLDANPYVSATVPYAPHPVRAEVAKHLEASYDDLDRQQDALVREAFVDCSGLSLEEVQALGIAGPNDYLVNV